MTGGLLASTRMSDVKKMRTIKFVVLCNWRVASSASMPEVKKMRAVCCCVTEGLLASAHTSDVKKEGDQAWCCEKTPAYYQSLSYNTQTLTSSSDKVLCQIGI